MKKFKYLEKLESGETTRFRSKKQETRLAKELKGYATLGSGSVFGENDVKTDYLEVEAKTTSKESFSLKLTDWRKMRKKCALSKIPVMIIDFETCKDSIAVLRYEDLKFFIEQAQKDNSD